MSLFDECFHTYADVRDKPDDFDKFFKKKIEMLQRIPIDIEEKKVQKFRKTFGAVHYEVKFRSQEKYQLTGDLFLPSGIRGKIPVVVYFPDYNTYHNPVESVLENDIALFILRLRGHLSQAEREKLLAETESKKGQIDESPGFFGENLTEQSSAYILSLYLDAFRTLEMLRLHQKIDTSRIGLWGRGTGAAMALFADVFMKRSVALVLEDPAFAYLQLTQNISRADYAEEINQYLKQNRAMRQSVKNCLNYFDTIHMAGQTKTPVMMSINLADKLISPRGGFALFHLLQSEKIMHIFPEHGSEDERLKEKKKKEAISSFFMDNF